MADVEYAIMTNTAGTDFGTMLASKTKEVIESYTDVTIDAAHSIPAGVFVKPRNGAKYLISGSGKMSFAGPGLQTVERRQIFQGADAGDVVWTGVYPDVIFPEWFGIVANSSGAAAANSAAWYVLMESLQGYNNSGTHILFGNGDYYFSESPQVNRCCLIEQLQGGRIVISANKSGFRVNGEMTHGDVEPLDHTSTTKVTYTGSSNAASSFGLMTITLTSALDAKYVGGVYWYKGGTLATAVGGRILGVSGNNVNVQVLSQASNVTVSSATGTIFIAEIYKSGEGTTFKNVEIQGTIGATYAHTISINAGLELTKSAGEDFHIWKKYNHGYTVSIPAESGQDSGRELTLVLKYHDTFNDATHFKVMPYRMIVGRRFSNNFNVDGYHYISQRFVGATVQFYSTNSAIHGQTRTIATVEEGGTVLTFNSDLDIGDNSQRVEIRVTAVDATKFSGVTARFNRWSGIEVLARTNCDNVKIRGFAGHGFACNSNLLSLSDPANQSQPNCNNSRFQQCYAYDNLAAGFYASGFNGNNIMYFQPDTQNNVIGMYQEPFLANSIYSNHNSYDRQGYIAGTISQPNGTIFYDPYFEGGGCGFMLGEKAAYGGGGATLNYPVFDGGATFHNDGGKWVGSMYEVEMFNKSGGNNQSSTANRHVSALGHVTYKSFQHVAIRNSLGRPVEMWYWLHNQQGEYSWAYYPHEDTSNPTTVTHEDALTFLTESHATLPEGEILMRKGVILQSPDGSYFRLTVSNAGAAVFTEI